jgi:hypothetical protein
MSSAVSAYGAVSVVMGVYDEIEDEFDEASEDEAANEEEVIEDEAIEDEAIEEAIIVEEPIEEELIVDMIDTSDKISDTAMIVNVTSDETSVKKNLVDRTICDFNSDGKINNRDKLYISSNLTMQSPNLNNRTAERRVLVSAYETE